jgi:hypothetical protein
VALQVIHCEIPARSFWVCKALPGFFLCIFRLLYMREETCFQQASGILCGGRYPPGCTGIFWPAERTRQPVTISKKWKNPSSALCRKRTWVQALPWFSTCSLGLPASGTDLKSQKGHLYSGPSQKPNLQGGGQIYRIWWRGKFIRQWISYRGGWETV